MATAEPDPPARPPTAEERVFTYSVMMFEKLGFTPLQAERLVTEGADWHDAERLVNRGCPVHLAFDLLT